MNPILIVEDDPDGQVLVAHVIAHLHIPHDVVGDAEKAMELLFQSDVEYQAVIIDLALPGKDGWQLLRAIRENNKTKELFCIAVTAFHTSKTRDEAQRAGFNAYFAKPLNASNFAHDLESLL
jgi:CheY-like chemotaxis protein